MVYIDIYAISLYHGFMNCLCLSLSRWHYDSESYFKIHSHNFYQLILCFEGKGRIIADNNEFFLKKNDYILIKPDQIHSIYGIDNFQTGDIKFIVNNEEYESQLNQISQNAHPSVDTLITKGQSMLYEINKRDSYFRESCDLILESMIIDLLRSFEKIEDNRTGIHDQEFTIQEKRKVGISGEIQTYLEKNYKKPIRLADLSNIFPLSYRQINKIFKRELGLTPGVYLERVRMGRAEEILITEKGSVKEAAYKTGYANVYHFSAVFKKNRGMSPGKWRDQVQYRIGKILPVHDELLYQAKYTY